MKYRKRPIVVEAVQWTGKFSEDVPTWVVMAQSVGGNMTYVQDRDELHIRTLEGIMIASLGDFIIQGVNKEVYPCKPDIFYKTYEQVTTDI